MPQDSVAYAVARVQYRMRDMLSRGHLERLLSAPSYEESLRALSEIGWVETGDTNIETFVTVHVRDACALVKALTPCPDATDCFMLRYDGLNLKTLIKARCRSKHAAILSECGIFPVDLLRHAVAERNYTKLPETLSKALSLLENSLAVREDALMIETAVDKALFEYISLKLQRVESPAIRRYFVGRVDILSAIMLLRVKLMGKSAAIMRDMLLPGGSIPVEKWAEAFEKPEIIPKLLAKYGERVIAATARAVQDGAALPVLEKAMDDSLLKPFSTFRYDPLRIEPVVGYLLGAEREAAAVRLIIAGKKNQFSQEAIEERLRDLYGE